MKSRLQSMGFTFGHLQAIGVGVLVVGGLVYAAGGFGIDGFFKADNQGNQEQVSNREMNATLTSEFTTSMQAAMEQSTAELKDSGAVLGNESNPAEEGSNLDVDNYFQPRGPR